MVTVGYCIVPALLLHGYCRLLYCYFIITASVLDCICAYTIKYKWLDIIPELKSLKSLCYLTSLLKNTVALVRQSHTKHLNTLCEENVRVLNVKSGVTGIAHSLLQD
jgi:hypothetical protein